MNNNLRRNQSL